MKKASSKFEALMRELGVSKKEFSEITGVKGVTITKYLANPSMLRLKHIECLAKQPKINESHDIISLIVTIQNDR
jgi:hypothetical protein|tara:strand:- start:1054 stop:1278 length:225 start_codon:yes stop_codon:yes gene_type:complete